MKSSEEDKIDAGMPSLANEVDSTIDVPPESGAAPAPADDDDDDFGPMPAPKRKKVRVDPNAALYLDNLPKALLYEKSYMHRSTITHVLSDPAGYTNFFISASVDGHVKFWKKATGGGIEFVKHYRAHMAAVTALCLSSDGQYLATFSEDRRMKLYDVENFDIIWMRELGFKASAAAFIGGNDLEVAVADAASNAVHIVRAFPHLSESDRLEKKNHTGTHVNDDAVDNMLEGPQSQTLAAVGSWGVVTVPEKKDKRPSAEAAAEADALPTDVAVRSFRRHMQPVRCMRYLQKNKVMVSTDASGALELWHPHLPGFPFPSRATASGMKYEMKSDTAFFELMKNKTHAFCLATDLGERKLATLCADGRLRLFSLETGRLIRVYDESLDMLLAAQGDSSMAQLHLERLDLGRRVALEKEFLKSNDVWRQNIVFDESGTFLLVPSVVGIKIYNTISNKLERIVGSSDSSYLRFLDIALFQGRHEKKAVQKDRQDPLVIATAQGKRRFYVISKRTPPNDALNPGTDNRRDIFNEMPSREDQDAAKAAAVRSVELRIGKNAVLHTTLGDVHVRLFGQECPRTVENFTVLARTNYYDNVIFHRVIKGFMIQTGDPNGNGTGGESIWGGDFEDEFHRSLRHDRPYTLSMANSGPDSNGSQFFVTTVPTPFLDNKHTVFGRVTKGFDVVHSIENLETNSSDRPIQDVKVLHIKVT